jgi:hypothetical protein
VRCDDRVAREERFRCADRLARGERLDHDDLAAPRLRCAAQSECAADGPPRSTPCAERYLRACGREKGSAPVRP